MIKFLTFDDIERLGRDIPDARQLLAKASTRDHKTVFLSHSSKDEKSLPLIIKVLENHGATVYVDVKDERLPETPSIETAKILRESLNVCRKFILFVTTNSKDSKWIPWELGVGDGEKSPRNVALIPAAKSSLEQSWAEQEYLGLYDRIVWGNFKDQEPEWLVYDHHDNSAVTLKEWISR